MNLNDAFRNKLLELTGKIGELDTPGRRLQLGAVLADGGPKLCAQGDDIVNLITYLNFHVGRAFSDFVWNAIVIEHVGAGYGVKGIASTLDDSPALVLSLSGSAHGSFTSGPIRLSSTGQASVSYTHLTLPTIYSV